MICSSTSIRIDLKMSFSYYFKSNPQPFWHDHTSWFSRGWDKTPCSYRQEGFILIWTLYLNKQFVFVSLHCFFCPAGRLGLSTPHSLMAASPCRARSDISLFYWILTATLWDRTHVTIPMVHTRKLRHRLCNFSKACKWNHQALVTLVTTLYSLRFLLQALGENPKDRNQCTWIWIPCHLSPPLLWKDT